MGHFVEILLTRLDKDMAKMAQENLKKQCVRGLNIVFAVNFCIGGLFVHCMKFVLFYI